MMQPMMTEAARQAPHVMSEMMKPMVMGAGGYAAARVLTTNPALSFLRAPLVVFAAGVTTGYLLHKYRREIIQAVTKVADMGKDFVLQQRESLDDLVAEAQEGNEAEAKAQASAEAGAPAARPRARKAAASA
jgi:pyruvate-formate lyase